MQQDSPHLSHKRCAPWGDIFYLEVIPIDVKSPKTYEQQVEIIAGKGFLVDDKESCIAFLNRANYYRLSAFFLPFQNREGLYYQEIPFKRVQRIYDFDCRIRAILFQAIEQIEFYLRTQFSYFTAHKYGTLGYLDDSIYSKNHNSIAFSQKIEQCIKENHRTPVVKHHLEKYNGNFPIWVVIEFFSIGMLSYFYSDLRSKDQKTIARESFHSFPACIKSWLRCLTDLRNRCAHYSRLYYWIFPAIPQMPKGCTYVADRKLFSQILMLKYLYPESADWNSHIAISIETLIKEYLPDISLKHIGFPENWESLLFSKYPEY